MILIWFFNCFFVFLMIIYIYIYVLVFQYFQMVLHFFLMQCSSSTLCSFISPSFPPFIIIPFIPPSLPHSSFLSHLFILPSFYPSLPPSTFPFRLSFVPSSLPSISLPVFFNALECSALVFVKFLDE